MKVELVGYGTRTSSLSALRAVLGGADRAVVCSAFVRRAGVNLVEPQLKVLGDRARLVATTAFGGDTTTEALNTSLALGVKVRVHNPARGTYHPKLYVGFAGEEVRALIGSANLTGGLVANVEVGTLLRGTARDPVLRAAVDIAESLWTGADATWTPVAAATSEERFDPELLRLIQREVARNPVFLTLSGGRPNRVRDVTRSEIWMETEASDAKGRPAQPIPAWMFELAWAHLRTHGSLTNAYLVANDGLNVKRSSAVCAILARLPGIEVAGRRPITLRLVGSGHGGPTTV